MRCTMEYRTLGRRGIKVSAVGIGGEGFENKSYEQCQEILDAAMREGINFIDIYNSNPQVLSLIHILTNAGSITRSRRTV